MKLGSHFIKVQFLFLVLLLFVFIPAVTALGGDIFVDSGQDLGSEWSRKVVLGDLDGDGDLDIIIANQNDSPLNGANHVWLNNGVGIFTKTGQDLGYQRTYKILLDDLDGDGDLDAFIANDARSGSSGAPNEVWLNNGSAIFAKSGQVLGQARSYGLALGDVDGDGDVDAVVGNHGSSRIWLNNGTAIFTDSGQLLSYTNSPVVELGDLDGDGDLDIFVGNHGATPSAVYYNDGSGVFTDTGQALGSLVTLSLKLGDLDGDGDLDAFLANSLASYAPGYNTVWFNNGSGYFFNSGQALGNAQSNDVALGDLDGDGDLDAYAPNHVGAADEVWFNDGNGYYTIGQYIGNANGLGVGLGDLDGDGDVDAVVVNWGQSNRVLFNTTSSPDGMIGTGGGTVLDSEGTGASFSVGLGVLPGNTNISITIIPDPGASPPPGYISPASLYVQFILSPNPSPLVPPGASIILPLAFSLPPGTALSLFKYLDTGSLEDTGVDGTVDPSGNSATFNGVTNFSVFAALQVDNQPPVAVCKNITVSADNSCMAITSIDNGSYDPDDDEITIAQNPAGPYVLGDNLVTLTVTDGSGESDSCIGTVTVVDNSCPTVTAKLLPVNVKKRKGCFRVELSAEDNCDENPQVVATINGAGVVNGQLVELKRKKKFNVKMEDGDSKSHDDDSSIDDCGTVKFEGPAFTLTATAIDSAGNFACEEATDTFVFSDDDSGSDHHKKKRKKNHGSDDDSNSGHKKKKK